MSKAQPSQRVEIGCVNAPSAGQIEQAAGVSEVTVDGTTLRCLVTGSFQPFLEALRGHEVITLQSTPAVEPMSFQEIEGDL
jgi:hypothetical protein